MNYRLRLLGRFELVSADGDAVPIVGKKPQAMVAILALAGGRPVPRSRLAAILWGDRGEAQARNSLRQTLTGLRKAFDGTGAFPFTITEETAAIDMAAVAVDAAGLGESEAGDGAAALAGEFLEGLDIPDQAAAEWLRDERRRLADLAARHLSRQIAAAEEAGDWAAGMAGARAALGSDPANEAMHRALMRALAATGERSRALKQFQICRETLEADLAAAPEPQTVELYEAIRTGRFPGAGDRAPDAAPEPQAAAQAQPTLAVLPFVNLSADPEQEYFSDGITDDIITELGRFRTLNVIARTSAFHFKGATPLVSEIRDRLGADYVVEGSVRKAGNRVRIAVRLSGTATGAQLWAEHFDRDLTDIFAVQDEITDTIAGVVHGRLDTSLQQRALGLAPERLGAYDLYLRAKALVWKFRPDPNREARALLERAAELDPRSAFVQALLSTTYQVEWLAVWSADRDRTLELAYVHARRAVDLDRDNSYAHWCLGEIQHYRRKYSEARSQLEEALRLNPNDVDALSMYGYFLACMGDHDKSLAQLERASRLDPYESYMHPWLSGAACYLAGRYEEAVQHLNRISDPLPEVYAWLAAAHGQLGQVEEAQRQAARFLAAAEAEMAVFPGRRLEDWEGYCRDIGCGPAGTADHFLEGLRAAWPGD